MAGPDAPAGATLPTISRYPTPASWTLRSRMEKTMKRSVLVVDDNVYLTRATAQALEAQGLQACGAMNATQALKLVAAQEFDGAIIDVDLKGRVDGVELLAAIRELRPGLSAVLTTGHETGVVDPPEGVMLMRKPYRMSELVAAMFKQDAAA
ncbi:response regulator [Lysobacter soli]|nr:response regulator [Lysobacter soli]